MNVLYVCADGGIPVLGNKGASVHVRSITAAMQQLGHRVTLVGRRWDAGNPAPALHRVERLPPDPGQAASLIEGLIRRECPDVVIERYSLNSGAARSATRRANLPLTLEVNAPLAAEARRYRGLDNPSAEQREHEVLRAADRIQVVSSALLDYVRSVAPGVPLTWIPNGADTARFHAPRSALLANLRGRLVIGFVGSMKPWHGVDQLLEAFAVVVGKCPSAALVLVGAGPEDARLAKRLKQGDLVSNVVWTGHVPHDTVPSLVAWFDIAVAPFVPVEGFYFDPLKVAEYLAAGKPVIYSGQGDLGALIGSAGLAYAPGSLDDLTDRLTQAVADPRLRARMAASAAQRAAALDWKTVAKRVLRFASGDAGAADPEPSLGGSRAAPGPAGARTLPKDWAP